MGKTVKNKIPPHQWIKLKKTNKNSINRKGLNFPPRTYIIFFLQLTVLLVSTTILDTSKMFRCREKVKAIKWMA
ncbi:hypothetical protein DKC15_001180 [Acinetobacter pittii]|nr:hypothetical protein DKC15_001180 [Acinetobacter pittii]